MFFLIAVVCVPTDNKMFTTTLVSEDTDNGFHQK